MDAETARSGASNLFPSAPTVGIIGGGPAGCAAALGVARISKCAKAQILLFESGGAITNKPCGDALVVGAVAALDSLGIPETRLAALGGRPSNAMVIHHSGHPREIQSLAPFRIWTLARSVLDKALRDHASRVCELHLHSRVLGIERVGRKWQLSVQCAGVPRRFVVDGVVAATGSLGNFAAAHGIDGRPSGAVAVTQYTSRHAVEDGLHFAFKRDFSPGYMWSFPMSSGANWGVWKSAEAPLDRLLDVRRRMLRLSRFHRFSQPRAAPARVWSGRGVVWHSPDSLVSCGDAAGLVEPYSGEGIWAALTSGSAAGAALASFLSGRAGALENYSAWVGDTFGASYARDGERAAFWRTIAER